MTNIKAEIKKLVSREGVDVRVEYSPMGEKSFYIDAAYAAKLESLVLELGEIAELINDYDCGREIVKSEIDGVTMLGTKHATNCGKCQALAKLTAKLGGM